MLCDLEIRNVLRLANLGVLCRGISHASVHACCVQGPACLHQPCAAWLGVPRDLHRHCLTSLFTRTMRRVCWISVYSREMEAQEDPAQVDHSWPQQQGFQGSHEGALWERSLAEQTVMPVCLVTRVSIKSPPVTRVSTVCQLPLRWGDAAPPSAAMTRVGLRTGLNSTHWGITETLDVRTGSRWEGYRGHPDRVTSCGGANFSGKETVWVDRGN